VANIKIYHRSYIFWKSEKIDTLSKEEFFYEFKEDNTFTADGWLNPFRGGLNHNKIKGTYLIQNKELKLIYLREETNLIQTFTLIMYLIKIP
jgi:hypothetical protein